MSNETIFQKNPQRSNLTCHALILNLQAKKIPPSDRRQEPEVHSEVHSDATSPAVADEEAPEEAPAAEPVEPVEDGVGTDGEM